MTNIVYRQQKASEGSELAIQLLHSCLLPIYSHHAWVSFKVLLKSTMTWWGQPTMQIPKTYHGIWILTHCLSPLTWDCFRYVGYIFGKVAREPLPLPGDHKYIWQDITKIIDELHIRNHKDSRCRMKYNPEVVKTISKTTNTMSCEQTFAWLSRFKKVICAMLKTHFHFFLRRMIKCRNLYHLLLC